jgi:mono/diheme cytochrome c family protein
MDQEPYKSEIDWKDLFKKPIKLFGYSYMYFLASLTVLGLFYIWNLNTIGKNSVSPTLLKDSTALIQDIPFQSPRVIPPVDVIKAGMSSTESVKKGHELYKNNCAACHGENGLGDGVSASMLNPKPRNLHSLSGWKNGSKVTQIYKTLQEGIPGSAMASYNYMPPEDRFALIHYIRTFGENQPQDTENDLKQLDAAYELSKGMNITGQIPIKKTLLLIERENIPVAERIQEISMQITASNRYGADLLRRVAFDEKTVVTSAVHMKNGVKSVDDFIKIVSADPLHSGFKASVVRLSTNEWIELYHYIFSVIK